MKPLLATFSGGPADGRESWLSPCATVTLGDHSASGSLFHTYKHVLVDWDSGRTVFQYVGTKHAPAPGWLRCLGLRFGFLQPKQVTSL